MRYATRGRTLRPFPYLAALVLLGSVVPPATAQPLAVEVAAAGFAQPLGVEVDPRGWVWVSDAGTGEDDGRILAVTPDGTVHPFATGFRSIPGMESAEGLTQLRLIDGRLWVAQGLTLIGESYLFAFDVVDYTPGDPAIPAPPPTVDVAAFVLGQGFAESNPYSLVEGPTEGTILFTDAAANAVLALDVDAGALSVVATFDDIENPTPVGPSFIQPVPTGIVARGGAYYVGALTGFPFVPGLARVYRLDGGAVSVYRDGLTSVTDLAVDPEDGQLVAVEFAEFDLASGFLPGTGRLVKLYENGARQTLADGLNFTAALDIAGDDHLFTSLFGLLHRGTPRVDLDVTPDAPVTAPGPVEAKATIINNTDATQTVTVRALLVTEGGIRQRASRTVSLAAGQSLTRAFSFTPPAGASFRVAFTAHAEGAIMDSDVVTVHLAGADGRAGEDVALDLDAWLDFGSAEAASAEAPRAARLVGSAPNPFSGGTTLTVALDAAAPVRLAVYDALGREVAVLVEGTLDAGTHPLRFEGGGLPAGVYLARLTAGETTETLRMTLLR